MADAHGDAPPALSKAALSAFSCGKLGPLNGERAPLAAETREGPGR